MNMSIWKESSDHLDEFFKAKSKALGQLKNAPRTCVSHFAKRDKKTGELVPDYADLATIFDTVRKTLSDAGIDITQCFAPYGEDGSLMLVTTLGHASGQFMRSFLPVKGGLKPQELAATTTTLKRIALCAFVGIAAEDDDDGETANRVAERVAVDDEKRIEAMAAKSLRDAESREKRKQILERVQKREEDGTLAQAAADRLRDLAHSLDTQPA